MHSYYQYKYYANLGTKQSTQSENEFKHFTILLNEDKTNWDKYTPVEAVCSDSACGLDSIKHNGPHGKEKEDTIHKLGKLLRSKIKAHSGEDANILTASKVIKENLPALVSVMYRLAAEDFLKNSKATFNIIECRNCTKLVSDWKPTLIDVLLSLNHQVIVVELQEFPHCTDFAYSILRQINYYWKIRLPRSFFYPDDVCTADFSSDQKVVVVTPLMPDGDIDLTNRIHDNLKYEILMMLKDSCANGLKNHLLKRDLRVGKFSDTENGVNSIRHIQRALQRRVKNKGDIQLGQASDDSHHLLLSLAGESLLTAECHLEYCKNPCSNFDFLEAEVKEIAKKDTHSVTEEPTGENTNNRFEASDCNDLNGSVTESRRKLQRRFPSSTNNEFFSSDDKTQLLHKRSNSATSISTSIATFSSTNTGTESEVEEFVDSDAEDGADKDKFFDDILKELKEIELKYTEKTLENELNPIPWDDTVISCPFLGTTEREAEKCLEWPEKCNYT